MGATSPRPGPSEGWTGRRQTMTPSLRGRAGSGHLSVPRAQGRPSGGLSPHPAELASMLRPLSSPDGRTSAVKYVVHLT